MWIDWHLGSIVGSPRLARPVPPLNVTKWSLFGSPFDQRIRQSGDTLTSTTHSSPGPIRSRAVLAGAVKLAALAILAVVLMAPAAGCGGKPDFCEDRTTLENSVKGLPSAATSGGVNGLESQLTQVESDAKALIDSAKSDYPNESSAIQSSINQLKLSAENLPEKPSAAQLAAVGLNASAVVNSVKAFSAATDESCK